MTARAWRYSVLLQCLERKGGKKPKVGDHGPMANAPESPTLGQRGQIFVTETAAQAYFFQRTRMPGCADMSLGDARRELTELLIDARCKREETTAEPASFRARSRKSQIDVGVTIRAEGRLLVVLSVQAREHLR